MMQSKLGLGSIALMVALLAMLAVTLWFAAGAWMSIAGPPMPRVGYIAMTLGIVFSLLIGCGLAEPAQAARFAMAFALGIGGCVFWLRGPDGEPGATLMALGGTIFTTAAALLVPVAQPVAIPAAILCLTLTLAHLSVMRRHPQHWQLSGRMRFRRL